VIVSPLPALMRNQVEAAGRAGIHARTINSANLHEWEEIQAEIAAGAVDVLLISPERLNDASRRQSRRYGHTPHAWWYWTEPRAVRCSTRAIPPLHGSSSSKSHAATARTPSSHSATSARFTIASITLRATDSSAEISIVSGHPR
jgi:hypothetical protein